MWRNRLTTVSELPHAQGAAASACFEVVAAGFEVVAASLK